MINRTSKQRVRLKAGLLGNNLRQVRDAFYDGRTTTTTSKEAIIVAGEKEHWLTHYRYSQRLKKLISPDNKTPDQIYRQMELSEFIGRYDTNRFKITPATLKYSTFLDVEIRSLYRVLGVRYYSLIRLG
jgi:hypothetical protein